MRQEPGLAHSYRQVAIIVLSKLDLGTGEAVSIQCTNLSGSWDQTNLPAALLHIKSQQTLAHRQHDLIDIASLILYTSST
jgi:hypothetical protein